MLPPPYHQNLGYTQQQEVLLIQGGKAYFDLLLRLIDAAKYTIHLQTYILQNDQTGQLIANALKAAAKRNVAVYLLVDGYASQGLSKHFIKALQEAGIQFRYFEPLFRNSQFYIGRRMHHKLFVVDAKYAVVGGVNIANRYNDMDGVPAWLDFALYVQGPLAQELCVLCSKTWNGFIGKSIVLPCNPQVSFTPVANGQGISVRMRRNDWVRHKNEISNTYIEMLQHARSQITIVCSYFLPGRAIRRLLSHATARGVKVQVVTTAQSDVPLTKPAERWLYDWLLRHQIELYEYQPTVLHAKIAVCDGEWFTIGSYNINNISTYASVELNLDIRNTALATDTEKKLQQMIQQNCVRVIQQNHRNTAHLFQQFSRWLSYQFIRLVFYLFTFYFKRTHESKR